MSSASASAPKSRRPTYYNTYFRLPTGIHDAIEYYWKNGRSAAFCARKLKLPLSIVKQTFSDLEADNYPPIVLEPSPVLETWEPKFVKVSWDDLFEDVPQSQK